MRKRIAVLGFYLLVVALPVCIGLSSICFDSKAQAPASLQYLVSEPRIKTTKPPLLILLHGYGSNEQDLFSLARQLPGNYLVVAVRAPVELGKNIYSWYPLEFSPDGQVRSYNFQAEEQSKKMLVDFIGQLKKKYAVDEHRVYLCGFSQGAMMSYSVALTRPDLVSGIAVMSGRLLKEIKPLAATKDKLKQLKIFISHGTGDKRIDIQEAKSAVAYLKSLGLTPVYKEYAAGHEINAAMVKDLELWLQQQ